MYLNAKIRMTLHVTKQSPGNFFSYKKCWVIAKWTFRKKLAQRTQGALKRHCHVKTTSQRRCDVTMTLLLRPVSTEMDFESKCKNILLSSCLLLFVLTNCWPWFTECVMTFHMIALAKSWSRDIYKKIVSLCFNLPGQSDLSVNKPSLVQIMAWCRTSHKPLCEPVMADFSQPSPSYCQLGHWEQISVKFQSKWKHFHWRK